MSFLQLVLSLDKTKEEIILFWRICQFDRYRNTYHEIEYQLNVQFETGIFIYCANNMTLFIIHCQNIEHYDAEFYIKVNLNGCFHQDTFYDEIKLE